VGGELTPRKESKKVFLMGNCSIKVNKGLEDAIRVKGCPPKVSEMLMALLNHTLDKKRARKILLGRLIKKIGNSVGIYNEDFPIYSRYKPPEFDQRHF